MSSFDLAAPKEAAKSFWKRAEGKFGIAGILGILGVGGALIYKALPYINELLNRSIDFAGKLITFGALAGVIGLAGVVLLDKRTWLWLSLQYKAFWVGAFDWALNRDPICMMKLYLERYTKRLNQVREQMNVLGGHIKELGKRIDDNNNEIRQQTAIAQRAQEQMKAVQGDEAEALHNAAVLAGRKVRSKTEVNERFVATKVLLEKVRDGLKKLMRKLELDKGTIETDIDAKEQLREGVMGAYSAFATAREIWKGNADEKALFERAMTINDRQIFERLEGMEELLDSSSGVLTGFDLEEGVLNEQALRAVLERTETFASGEVRPLAQLPRPSSDAVIDAQFEPHASVAVGKGQRDVPSDIDDLLRGGR